MLTYFVGARDTHRTGTPLSWMETLFFHGDCVDLLEAVTTQSHLPLRLLKNVHEIGAVVFPATCFVVAEHVAPIFTDCGLPLRRAVIEHAFLLPYSHGGSDYKLAKGYRESRKDERANHRTLAQNYRVDAPTVGLWEVEAPVVDDSTHNADVMDLGIVHGDTRLGERSAARSYFSRQVILDSHMISTGAGRILSEELFSRLRPHLDERYWWWKPLTT